MSAGIEPGSLENETFSLINDSIPFPKKIENEISRKFEFGLFNRIFILSKTFLWSLVALSSNPSFMISVTSRF